MKQYLYRFRSCTDYNFSALNNSQIWCSPTEQFADPRDGAFHIDTSQNIAQARELLIHIGRVPFISETLKKAIFNKSGILLSKEQIEEITSCFDKNYNLNEDKLKTLPYDSSLLDFIRGGLLITNAIYEKCLYDDETIEVILRNIQSEAVKIAQRHSKKLTICCFTETYKNDAMWESFADSFRGFCCRYDMSRIEIVGLSPFQKVIYDNKPIFNFTNFFWAYSKSDLTQINQEFISQFIYKDKSMSYQKEWRFFNSHSDPVDSGDLITFDVCDSIILGIKISNGNKNTLLKIAKEKQLYVYEQRLSSYGNFYYKLIQK